MKNANKRNNKFAPERSSRTRKRACGIDLTDSDVVVVGAGPCGSFAAFAAAKLGADVVVYEEHKKIGVPAHCPGHLSLSGLRRLGLKLPSRLIENEFRGAIFYSPSGKQFRVRLDSSVTGVVNRELFDQYLADLAKRQVLNITYSREWSRLLLSEILLKALSSIARVQGKLCPQR